MVCSDVKDQSDKKIATPALKKKDAAEG